jgi:hypothetical protein
MKNKLFLIILCLTTIQTFSQTNEFAPIGAKWWYSFITRNDITEENKIIPFYMESVGDTNIQGKNCRIIKSYIDTNLCYKFYSYDNTLFYVYSDSNKVYYYNQFANNYYLLYNFNANSGDSWEIYIDSTCSKTILIDSVNIINVNGFSLKELYYHNFDTLLSYNSRIIENIGFSNNFLIPEHNITCNNVDTCNFPFYKSFDGLKCYADSFIGEFNYHWWVCNSCNCADTIMFYTPSVSEIKTLKPKYVIYPNPVKNIITVKSIIALQNTYDVELYNCYGELILKKNSNTNESSINISYLSKGIYYLKIYNYETISTFKMVKE